MTIDVKTCNFLYPIKKVSNIWHSVGRRLAKQYLTANSSWYCVQ